MAIGTALLGLLAFLLGCSGTSAEPQNSERLRKVGCGAAGRGSQPPSWKAPATSLFSGGRQVQRRGCRFLGVGRIHSRCAERQRL